MMSLRSSLLFVAVSAVLGAPGCTVATGEEEEVWGTDESNAAEGPEAPALDDGTVSDTLGPGDPKGIITGNGASPLTPEILNLWAPVARFLTLAPLTPLALETSTLLSVVEGRTFMDYVVKCALPAGATMTVSYLGATHTFKGHVGIAAEWATGALTESSRRWLSACIMAHVNPTGKQVTLLLRGDHPALNVPSGASTGEFALREGGFYGDIFALTPAKHACVGAGTTQDRMCTKDVAGLSPCGFTVPGYCRGSSVAACEGLNDGAYETCHSEPLAGSDEESIAYPETITVYLKPMKP
jgi:hypothetical protein